MAGQADQQTIYKTVAELFTVRFHRKETEMVTSEPSASGFRPQKH